MGVSVDQTGQKSHVAETAQGPERLRVGVIALPHSDDAVALHRDPSISNRRPVDRHDPRRGEPHHATGDWGRFRWRLPVALRAS